MKVQTIQAKRNKGFNLIEVMVVVGILGILAAIAWPSYNNSVMKTRRADGKEALLSAAANQEKIFMQRNRYSADMNDLGGSASKDGHYTLSVTQPSGTSTFTLTATATGVQTSDTDCAVFTVTHTGLQKAYNSGNAENTNCW